MVDLDFPYPMTVSGLGMVSSSVLSYVACKGTSLVEVRFTHMTPGFWIRRMLPVGLFMVRAVTRVSEALLVLAQLVAMTYEQATKACTTPFAACITSHND